VNRMIGICLLVWGTSAVVSRRIHSISMAGPFVHYGLEAVGWGLLIGSLGLRFCLEGWAESIARSPRWEWALFWLWRTGAAAGLVLGMVGFVQRLTLVVS
jgi:hypothetical protein